MVVVDLLDVESTSPKNFPQFEEKSETLTRSREGNFSRDYVS